MTTVSIEKSLPKVVVVAGVDRVGKNSLLEEIDRQTRYKHMTMDRGPESFQAYCDIFNKGDDLKEIYKDMETQLSDSGLVLAIYIDCSTEELIRRCIETDHEILDFDYHKSVMEYYFDEAPYENKVKIDTTEKHVSEIVKELIDEGVL